MKVELLSHTPQPEKLCAMAAKLCYSAGMPRKKDLTPDKAGPFLERIMESGHLSVLEHACFTFGIEGISRACSHQLVRHRLASFSQQSQRYVEESTPNYIVPGSVVEAGDAINLYNRHMEQSWVVYKALLAEGIPAEDARFVLPNAAETKLVMTMNVRELRHFFMLRLCSKSQWEIRALAGEMFSIVSRVSPILFLNCGPACVSSGRCLEQKPCKEEIL
jgi:thymidylate synthase (FAD)